MTLPQGPKEEDLDEILQSALDDFGDDDVEETLGLREAPSDLGKKRSEDDAAVSDTLDLSEMEKEMDKLLADLHNPQFQKSLEETFKQLKEDSDSAQGGKRPTSSIPPGGSSDVDKTVAQTLLNLQEVSKEVEGMQSAQAEQMGENLMSDMMKELEHMGEKEDFQQIIDGMMKQLLSKEVMYEPIKQICEKFPAWLAEKEDHLTREEYERYGRQYQYFQQIVAVYETEPENYDRLMELMQDMQECGQPPAEIVKELAPGLQFDEEGMPVMPNMGPGMMPPGIPPQLAGMAGGEDCVIM